MISTWVVGRGSDGFHLLAVATEILNVLLLQDLLRGDEVCAPDGILICHLLVFRVKHTTDSHTDCRFAYAGACLNDAEALIALEKGVDGKSNGIDLCLTWFVKWKSVLERQNRALIDSSRGGGIRTCTS